MAVIRIRAIVGEDDEGMCGKRISVVERVR
jgi:hypothetical protein